MYILDMTYKGKPVKEIIYNINNKIKNLSTVTVDGTTIITDSDKIRINGKFINFRELYHSLMADSDKIYNMCMYDDSDWTYICLVCPEKHDIQLRHMLKLEPFSLTGDYMIVVDLHVYDMCDTFAYTEHGVESLVQLLSRVKLDSFPCIIASGKSNIKFLKVAIKNMNLFEKTLAKARILGVIK